MRIKTTNSAPGMMQKPAGVSFVDSNSNQITVSVRQEGGAIGALRRVIILVLTALISSLAGADVVTADFNGTGQIDIADFAAMALRWQTTLADPDFDTVYDLDNDNDVDTGDLCDFVQQWLSAPEPPTYLAVPTSRQKLTFNVGWRFYKGAIANDAAQSPSYDDAAWTAVNLPHNPPMGASVYDPLRPAWSTGYSYEGPGWYRKHFGLDAAAQGKKIFIEFEAANTVTDVWINGTHMTTHYGGYLPFTHDITPYVNFGAADNVIAVKADNTDNANVPIGKPDWFNWGGIYRDVWLHITDNLHVTDAVFANTVAGGGIFITYPSVDVSSAQVQVKTEVRNESIASANCTLRSFIVDTDNVVIAQMAGTQTIAAGSALTFTQSAIVPDPHLWHPNSPYLYMLYTEVYDGTIPADIQQTRIGIRSVSFSKSAGLSINGQPFKARGTNRLQDYPWWGYAIGNVSQRRDAVKLKEAGFDYIRTSHYPQDPAFMEACDELGILVMDAIPGFQHIGDATFKNHSYQNMREMIRRDRNHPCVIAWELSLNETWWTDPDYSPTAVSIGHAEYPGSFIAGWKDDAIYDVFIATPSAGARTYSGTRPLVISEYGHWEYGGDNGGSDVRRGSVGDKYNYGESAMLNQAANHLDGYHQNLGMSNMCGDGLWVGIDYGPYPSGVLDIYRLPKFSYYFWKSQRDPDIAIPGVSTGPMVYIANYWKATSPATVKVFSNCQQVRLYKNDVLFATRAPDAGRNVPHPPFTFTGLTYTAGTLRAEGLINGQIAATHTVRTPGAATRLSAALDTDVPANGSETVFVYVSITDSEGTLVSSADNTNVTLSVTGPAQLACPATVKSEAGIAAGMIRVGQTPGLITVTATASGLTPATVSFTSG